MVTKLIMACILSATLLSCNGQNTNTINYATVEPLHINRFDKDLFRLIDTEDTTLQPELIKQYPEMLDIIGKGILNLQTIETPGFFEKMRNYYSEPTLKGLYRDAITQYASVEDIEKSLGYGFAYLKENFPSMQIPAIYMHVSGFNQNVLVGDSLLSLSIDKYMGKDYPLYQDFFYDSQKLKMQRGLVVGLSGGVAHVRISFRGKRERIAGPDDLRGKNQIPALASLRRSRCRRANGIHRTGLQLVQGQRRNNLESNHRAQASLYPGSTDNFPVFRGYPGHFPRERRSREYRDLDRLADHQPVHEGDGIYPGGVDAKQRRPRNPNRLKVQTPINRKTALFSRTRRIT